VTPESVMMESTNSSPRIKHVSWGRLEVDGKAEPYKDAKLFPGGSRDWNWRETGTGHNPGIQVADVQELLKHGAHRGRAFARNGRMPSGTSRDARFFERTPNRRARLADSRSRGALQQTRRNRAGRWTFSYDVLTRRAGIFACKVGHVTPWGRLSSE
jgi:hypothetical protein